MAIRDLADVPSGSGLRADVCVVGAGAAGITLALSLAESGLEVVLLESGGLEKEAETQALARGDVVGAPLGDLRGPDALAETRLRLLGGTTGHWAGFCRTLEAVDLEARPELGRAGWPFGRSELDPWYEAALPVLGIGPLDFSWEQWGGRFDVPVDPLAGSDLVRTEVFQVSPQRFGSRFRPALEAAAGIDTVLHANVVDLVLAEGSDVLDRVVVAGLDGTEATVEARVVVLAAGGIENARLLLAADGQRPAGLGNERDLVGRHFCEHPQVFVGVATSDLDEAALQRVFADGATAPRPPGTPDGVEGDLELRSVIAFSDDAVRGTDRLSVVFQAYAGGYPGGAPEAETGLSTRDVGTLQAVVDGQAPQGTLVLLASGEQDLNPASRVTLGDERDVLGMRRVVLDWQFTERDRRSLVDAVRLLGTEMGRLGVGRAQVTPGNLDTAEGGGFVVDVDAADPDGFPMGIGFHHLCTTRMAGDPAEGVVDADLRVHTVDNLYVAGSSSFATAGAATPTFTIVALALRLADHLQRTLA